MNIINRNNSSWVTFKVINQYKKNIILDYLHTHKNVLVQSTHSEKIPSIIPTIIASRLELCVDRTPVHGVCRGRGV